MSLRLGLAAAIALLAIAGGALYFGGQRPAPAATVSPVATPSPNATLGTTAAPSTTPPFPSAAATAEPQTFTSPLYAYTVDRPSGWDVVPATIPWPERTWSGNLPSALDTFLGPPGDPEDYDDVVVAAQPIPADMTPSEWLLDNAERQATSARDCKGQAEDWSDAVVGSLDVRRIDLDCGGTLMSDVAFVVDGTGYVMIGNRPLILILLDSFRPGTGT